jgi:hypothetical protein
MTFSKSETAWIKTRAYWEHSVATAHPIQSHLVRIISGFGSCRTGAYRKRGFLLHISKVGFQNMAVNSTSTVRSTKWRPIFYYSRTWRMCQGIGWLWAYLSEYNWWVLFSIIIIVPKMKYYNLLQGSYTCGCKFGFELHSNGKECEDACGGVIEDTNGSLTSPSFPNLYPSNRHCAWEIVAPPQTRITINFTHFDLEGNNVRCSEKGQKHPLAFSSDNTILLSLSKNATMTALRSTVSWDRMSSSVMEASVEVRALYQLQTNHIYLSSCHFNCIFNFNWQTSLRRW